MRSVPSRTSRVACTPSPSLRLASRQVPRAGLFGLALSSFSSATTRQLIEQFVDALAGGGAGFDERRVAAHVVGQHVQAVKLLRGLVDVGAGHVDLVDGDDERHAGRLGVADGFLGLRHDAVVGGDDDDGDVGDLGAAGPHLGEGLVAGRIEERDRLAAVLDAPGADHLRDAARLGGGDVALANLVQQLSFAVVDVAHDGHDRGARHQVFRLVGLADAVFLEDVLFGVERVLDFQLAAVFQGDDLGHVRLDDRVDVHHGGAVVLELEQDLDGAGPDRLGQAAHSDRRVQRYFALSWLRIQRFLDLAFGIARMPVDGFIVIIDDDLAADHLDLFAFLGPFLAIETAAIPAGDALGDLFLAAFIFFLGSGHRRLSRQQVLWLKDTVFLAAIDQAVPGR